MLLKFNARVQEIHQPDQQKQHSNLGQSYSLPIMCILQFQCNWFLSFGLVASYIVIHACLCNLLILVGCHWFFSCTDGVLCALQLAARVQQWTAASSVWSLLVLARDEQRSCTVSAAHPTTKQSQYNLHTVEFKGTSLLKTYLTNRYKRVY